MANQSILLIFLIENIYESLKTQYIFSGKVQSFRLQSVKITRVHRLAAGFFNGPLERRELNGHAHASEARTHIRRDIPVDLIAAKYQRKCELPQ